LKIPFKEINYLTENNLSKKFAQLYISVRIKENRVLSDKQLLQLPNAPLSNTNFKEWQVRKKSAHRFLNYLSNRKSVDTILDLGCGNGWFSNLIAKSFPSIKVTGLDINEVELKQANRVFQRRNLNFAFANIFQIKPNVFKEEFSIVVLNASVQYFPNFLNLLSKIITFLEPNGEIHIIDSPFYKKDTVLNAKERTVNYYTKLGFPEMAEYYFHHSLENLKDFEILYRPKKMILFKFLKKTEVPFLWAKKAI